MYVPGTHWRERERALIANTTIITRLRERNEVVSSSSYSFEIKKQIINNYIIGFIINIVRRHEETTKLYNVNTNTQNISI